MSESDRESEMREDYDFSEAVRGPVVAPTPGKTRITIRLDNDILEWFRTQVHQAGGGNYQTLINEALRDYISCRQLDTPEALAELFSNQKHLATLRNAFVHGLPFYLPQLRELVRQVVREELERVK
jgi:uncharacterized protein (DUF4415 family)